MNFPSYTSYKCSGAEWVGDIPGHWNIQRLKFIATLAYGDPLSAENRIDGETNVFGSNGVVGTHEIANTKSPMIVVGRKGSFGKINFSNEIGFAIDTTFFIDERYTEHNIKWLYYVLGCLGLDKNSKDSAVPGLAREDAYEKLCPVPPSDEQEELAQFIDRETARIDALIEKKRHLLELLEEKRLAVITQAVTKGLDPTAPMKDSGIDWLGEVPAYWKLMPLKRLLRRKGSAIKVGPFGTQLMLSDMMTGKVKVYNQRTVIDKDFDSGDYYVTEDKFDELKAFEVFTRDLLITTRGTIGRCAIVPDWAERGILHPCLMRVQPEENRCLPEFLELLIEHSSVVLEQLKLKSNATTIDVIYSDTLKNVLIPVPLVEEQRSIVKYATEQSAELIRVKKKIADAMAKLGEYRSAVITNAVTGKIDVRDLVGKENAA